MGKQIAEFVKEFRSLYHSFLRTDELIAKYSTAISQIKNFIKEFSTKIQNKIPELAKEQASVFRAVESSVFQGVHNNIFHIFQLKV